MRTIAQLIEPHPPQKPALHLTQYEVAKLLGCTRENVRQAERNALRKLRLAFRNDAGLMQEARDRNLID